MVLRADFLVKQRWNTRRKWLWKELRGDLSADLSVDLSVDVSLGVCNVIVPAVEKKQLGNSVEACVILRCFLYGTHAILLLSAFFHLGYGNVSHEYWI